MHVNVEQGNKRAVNLSIREGLLLWHRRALGIVVVGETGVASQSGDGSYSFDQDVGELYISMLVKFMALRLEQELIPWTGVDWLVFL